MKTSGDVEFTRPDGLPCPAYYAAAGPGRPGIVVIQEWWGLNAQIRGVAERYAAAGFNALAPDLYRGRMAANVDEASHLMDGLDFADATFQDIRGAVAWLAGQGCARVAVTGFCMGGALTVACAVHLPEVVAAVCYYGIPPRDFADPGAIRTPFQGHFATRDTWCTPVAVVQLEAALPVSAGLPEIHRYEAAHAFFNASRPEVYDRAAAELSWSRTQAFLKRWL